MSNPSLYGHARNKQKPSAHSQSTSTPSSSTLAFTTTLSSLITKDESSTSTRGRLRPSKAPKSDLFSRPNKGAQKRAAADLRDDGDNSAFEQKHQRTEDIGAVEPATLHRSKRRMEEKARMYDDLKSGRYLAGGGSSDEDGGGDVYLARLRRREREGLVDFDQKWADEERGREGGEEEEEADDDNASIVSYEDELGRSRRGTRAEAAAARAAALKEQEAGGRGRGGGDAERWRPARPDNLIYGATVQAEAFNPDAEVASQMSYLAARRDRSPTPPEETHYDADAEVRNRGTGFYAFSKDENVRKQQMEELLHVREETQRERDARRERRAERQRLRDERRMKVDELRAKRRAEMFLAGLGDVGVLAGGGA
ncbi:hypothetical protein BO70DRAFT_425086 [Aspergillus heteromorphus CBS 117.55]|uniref:Uncharacterized protein n=1 Tax=Aspergillus heteromorphus CBS 117.55 TaxID=1448321 RepID=A0A317X207_9EURO|nr:uncharacterized protein BO70DRAFT_425086 [Aspergillus heteromorphus CBS 117.55]PWY92385.1 hypothetical protein BO70DRAFT_425086 [Aspergillus heteromorphus CBS 117.55]